MTQGRTHSMSGPGQQRSSSPRNPTSGLLPTTDSSRTSRHFRKVPKAEVPLAWKGAIARMALPQRIEQRLCIFQDRRVEPFGEPTVDRCEEITGFGALALVAPEAGEASSG